MNDSNEEIRALSAFLLTGGFFLLFLYLSGQIG